LKYCFNILSEIFSHQFCCAPDFRPDFAERHTLVKIYSVNMLGLSKGGKWIDGKKGKPSGVYGRSYTLKYYGHFA
jgi:hypothetical protein